MADLKFDNPRAILNYAHNFNTSDCAVMTQKQLISANQQRFSARIFNLASIIATVIPPLLMIWIAASIFAYASVAHHPSPRVVHYNRIAGYRFYGAAGTMVVFGQPIYGLFGNWHGLLAVWAILALVVIPLGLRDLIRVQREDWQDMEIEVNAS